MMLTHSSKRNWLFRLVGVTSAVITCDVGLSQTVDAAFDVIGETTDVVDIVVNNARAIVNTCSIAATVGLRQHAAYSARKGTVRSLTRAMAADLVHENIHVNCVNPGTADTPWVARLLDKVLDPVAERAALEQRQPSGRLVTADEVASAICFLASPDQRSTTGSVLAVDGGMDGLRVTP